MLNKRTIFKATGEEVAFEPLKLRQSLLRAGASPGEAEAIAQTIIDSWQAGLTTKQVYREAHRLLQALAEGFQVEKGAVHPGKCVEHEVDIFARNKSKIIFGECKFRNSQQLVNDARR